MVVNGMKNELLKLSRVDNQTVSCRTGNITLRRLSVGQIQLPTGIICALDPLTLLDSVQAIHPSVPPGSYSVYLSVAHMVSNWPTVHNRRMSFEKSQDQRVAFAVIEFSQEQATNWRMAYSSDQDESMLDDGNIYGYLGYSGKGCFMDKTLAEMLRRQYGTDYGYYDKIVSEMDKTSYTCSYTNLELAKDSNLIAFSTGFGSGIYASYFGYGQSDEIVCLVTDFGIVQPLDMEKPEVKPYVLPSARRGLWVGTKYDWRVSGQKRYLKGVKLVRRKYRQNPRNPDWDHDHCEFCWATFCLENHPDCLKEGYTTLDDYHWVCPTCFEDFKYLFKWEVLPDPDV